VGAAVPQKNLETDVGELVQAIGLIVRRFRTEGGENELSWSDAFVLRRLAKDGPATTAELAREAGIKPQSMGTIVAALEATGMVERKPHLTDGRRVNLTLTAKGAAARKSAGDAKRSWLARAVAQIDEEERETLFAAAEILKKLAGLR
jgi:DNA-binding MarR family transcriptional regulator